MSLFNELKRRNVFRVGAAYVITAWLLLQVADIVIEHIHAPEWVFQIFMLALVLGLPLALFFAWAFELTPEGLKKEKDVDRAQSITHHTGRKLDRTIIIVLILALGYFIYESRFSSPTLEDNVIPDRAQRASGTQSEAIGADADRAPGEAGAAERISDEGGVDLPPTKSIAVLPFVNMSDDASNEYFSDGISEEILNALARVKDLKVAGRTSSFAFKGQNQDLRVIGDTLGVGHILEGSVRKAGNRVRVTAQLIQVDDGFHLWSESYDRELTDVFAIQDEIAAQILAQLKTHLVSEGMQAPIESTRADVAAYDLYLAAKEQIYLRSRASLETAHEQLTQALQIDPGYAPAHAQLAITSLLLSNQAYGETPLADSLTAARPSIDKALELDPQMAEGHAALALFYELKPGADQNGIDAAKRALEINPSLVNARNWMRNGHMNLGNLREVAKLDAEIMVRDPLYVPGIGNAVLSFGWSGKTAEAQALIDRIGPFVPDSPIIPQSQGVIDVVQGQTAASLGSYARAFEMAPDDAVVHNLYSLALLQANDYEKLVAIGNRSARVTALLMLDRPEEAMLLAQELAATGEDISALIYLYAQQGRYPELIEFIESRWPSVSAYEAEFPERNGWGSNTLGLIAQAYRHAGDEGKFQSTMSLYRFVLDNQREQGADNIYITFSEAMYHQLAGDEEQALLKLAQAVESGWTSHVRISKAWPAFRPLEGHPEYEAIQSRMTGHLDAERTKMDLEPVST